MSKFKLYGSKMPIFWNKNTEDRPSQTLFKNFDFQWVEFPLIFSFIDAYSGKIVLEDSEYTYFKLENTETKEETYWFVEDREKILSKGVLYILNIDIYASYVLKIFDKLDNEGNVSVGVERTHLGFEDYKKYIFPYIQDELLSKGDNGEGVVYTQGFIPIEYIRDGYEISFKEDTNTTSTYRRLKNNITPVYAVSRCYVFYPWTKSVNTTDENSTLWIFPVIETQTNDNFYYSVNGAVNIAGPILGNLDNELYKIVQNQAAKFLGCYFIPFFSETEEDWNEKWSWITDGDRRYYFRPLSLGANRVKTAFNRFWKPKEDIYKEQGEVCFPSPDLIFNDTKTEFDNTNNIPTINYLSFLQLNSNWYGNQIAPTTIFDMDGGGSFYVRLNGSLQFNKGFSYLINSFDNPISMGGELPSDKQSYSNYVNGIREQMNTAITVSKTNMLHTIAKNAVQAVFAKLEGMLGGLGMFFGGGAKSASQMLGGLSGEANAYFNMSGALINHASTVAMYSAQLTDAFNSIPPSFANTNESDIRRYLLARSAGAIRGLSNENSVMFFKKLTKRMVNFHNNLVFLFGGAVKNFIPWSVLKSYKNSLNLPCWYISFTKDYVSSAFLNLVRKVFPKIDNKLVLVIAEAMLIGYRLWKEAPDYTKQYNMRLV